MALEDYKVYIDASAEQDLFSIVSYISDTLKEPVTAKRIYTSIKERIRSLRQMPERYNIVRDEPFARLGVRKLFIENFTVFYFISDKREVHVFRVLYNRREWQNILID